MDASAPRASRWGPELAAGVAAALMALPAALGNYQLTREAFEAASREVPALREELPARLNRVLSFRLRVTTQQLRAAEE